MKHIYAFSLEPEIMIKAKEICKKTGRSLSAIIELFLVRFIKEENTKEK